MAGDWIAFECATLEKPEVYKIARMLKVSRGDALLLLLTFWVWVDRNSSNGKCDALVTHDVDNMMHCVGFGAAMSAVGWLNFDDKKERITIPGFDTHHGKSAKKRLLASRRSATHRQRKRNATGVTNASTTEENRRVLKPMVASQPVRQAGPVGPVGPVGPERPSISGNDSKAKRGQELTADAKNILDFLNAKAGRNFPPTTTNVGIIVARFNEGFTATQIRQVVALKVRQWKGDEKMDEYLRPLTLFGRQKFSSYVGSLVDLPDDGDA